MKKVMRIVCVMLIALLIPALFALRSILPLNKNALIEKKYAGWNGVLRIWIYEGWQSGAGSFVSWLNRCAGIFEKQHNGVYLQIQPVSETALQTFPTSGIRPPDAILFPPGLLDGADHLISLPDDLPVRESLQEHPCAVPVAMGGYAWVIHDADSSAVSLTENTVAAPGDTAYQSSSAALLSLCSGLRQAPETSPLPGVDLRLTEAAPAATEPPGGIYMPIQLNPAFEFRDTPVSDFIRGDLNAIMVSSESLATLMKLQERGLTPDWTLLSDVEYPFTDQLLMMSVVDGEPEQEALCVEFLRLLLQEDSQGLLKDWNAFSTTEAFTGYTSPDPRAGMETVLRRSQLMIPPAFSRSWRDTAALMLEEYLRDTRSASESILRLFVLSRLP